MTAFYNEIDPYAAQWLRNLIAAGHIAPGVVDERSIEDLEPDELRRYTQCHFFAGIGVWSYALRLAGWSDDRPVWTGSCPCQPFSAAGKAAGFADERHLWPAFHHLISQCRPSVVFGEQVASKDGLEWLDLVQADLEGSGYASAAADLCAAGIGAPHIRQRLYWVANTNDAGLEGRGAVRQRADQCAAGQNGVAGGLGDSKSNGPEVRIDVHGELQGQGFAEGCDVGGVADADCERRDGQYPFVQRQDIWRGKQDLLEIARDGEVSRRPSQTDSFWRASDWLLCRDGKWRPVEPGTFPLAHGASARVGRLRAYGNAIVPQVAATFIAAYLAVREA